MKTLIALALALISLPALANPELKSIPVAPPKVKKPAKLPCPKLDLFKALATKDAGCLKEAAHHMDPNETNAEGDTPLHLAIRQKNRVGINFMLRNGANLNQRNHERQTPKELAEALGFRKLSDYLNNMEIETERLMIAVDNDDLSAANASLLRGASIGTRNSRHDTILHRAVMSNLPEMTMLLIRYGSDVNARNYLGETPLHSAALRDFKPVMRILIAAGANVSALNHRRETPLDLATVLSDPEILAMLEKKKARNGTRADVSLEMSGGEGEDIEASAPSPGGRR